MRGTVLVTLLALTSATCAENVKTVNINGNSQTWVNGKQVGGPKNHPHGNHKQGKPWGSWESTTVNGQNNIVNGKPVKNGVTKTVTQGTGPFGWGSTTQTTITGNGNVVSRRALDSLLDEILEAREAPAVYRRGGNIVSTMQTTDIDARSLLARRYLQDLLEARGPPAKKDNKPKKPAQKNFVNVQGSGNTVNGKSVSSNSVTTSTRTGGNWWDSFGSKTETTITGNGVTVQVRDADPESDPEAFAEADPDPEAEADADADAEAKISWGYNWNQPLPGLAKTVVARDAEPGAEAYADADPNADPDADAEIDIDYELFIRAAPPAPKKDNKPIAQKNVVNVKGKGNTIDGKAVGGNTNTVSTTSGNDKNWWFNWAKGLGVAKTETTVNGDNKEVTVVTRDAEAEAEAEWEGEFWEFA